jgi:hypothetical protein
LPSRNLSQGGNRQFFLLAFSRRTPLNFFFGGLFLCVGLFHRHELPGRFAALGPGRNPPSLLFSCVRFLTAPLHCRRPVCLPPSPSPVAMPRRRGHDQLIPAAALGNRFRSSATCVRQMLPPLAGPACWRMETFCASGRDRQRHRRAFHCNGTFFALSSFQVEPQF